MKKSFCLIIICCFINQFIVAQNSLQQLQTTVHFQSILQGGLLAGKSKPGFEFQTINGVKWKTFSAGIGVGLDNYFVNSIPVFFDVRTDFSNRSNTPFLFIDAGSQLLSKKYSKPDDYYFDLYYKAKFYFNAGAGYKINLFKKNAMVLSASFSLKKINEVETPFCDWAPCQENPPPFVIINKYNLKRFSLQIGWSIW